MASHPRRPPLGVPASRHSLEPGNRAPVASPTSRASPIAASPCARAAPASRRLDQPTDRPHVDLKMNYCPSSCIRVRQLPGHHSFSYYTKDESGHRRTRPAGGVCRPLLNAPGHTGTILGSFPQFQVADDSGTKALTTSTSSDPPPLGSTSTSSTDTWTRSATEWHMELPTSSS